MFVIFVDILIISIILRGSPLLKDHIRSEYFFRGRQLCTAYSFQGYETFQPSLPRYDIDFDLEESLFTVGACYIEHGLYRTFVISNKFLSPLSFAHDFA